jgi:sirohydrochlorin ferrochelatase
MNNPYIFLVDNGSLRPQAILCLRRFAAALSQRSGFHVEAVSLLHSCKVPAEALGGVAATIVKQRLQACLDAGQRNFICLPFFLGPSSAIVDYLPRLLGEFRERYDDLRVKVAPVLSGGDLAALDSRLVQILAEQVRAMSPDPRDTVALVDHGTPVREVNQVRNTVAHLLAEDLGAAVARVIPCSMERRPGLDYAFNDPLLEDLGQLHVAAGGRLILAMFFLLPGRHAGPGGDIAEICDGLVSAGAFERVDTTPLLGEHPMLLDILEDRLNSVLPA